MLSRLRASGESICAELLLQSLPPARAGRKCRPHRTGSAFSKPSASSSPICGASFATSSRAISECLSIVSR